MAISETPATPDAARVERPFARLAPTAPGVANPTGIVERLNVALWRIVHPLGAHRWRDGYDVDADRGWVQYRGSRCTVCDEPWEGW